MTFCQNLNNMEKTDQWEKTKKRWIETGMKEEKAHLLKDQIPARCRWNWSIDTEIYSL